MAILKVMVGHTSLGRIINYVTQDAKTAAHLVTGINCCIPTAADEMLATKALYNKTGGTTYRHLVIAFPPDEHITPEQVQAFAVEWVRGDPRLDGYETVVVTHIDKHHLHAHIVCNSVSLADGRKMEINPPDLRDMLRRLEHMCRKYGYTVCGERKETTQVTSFNIGKYRLMEQAIRGEAKSYLWEAAVAVKDSMLHAKDKADFVEGLRQKGYTVIWEEGRKYITFIDAEGNRVRDRNLEKTFHLGCMKEQLEERFSKPAKEVAKEQQKQLAYYAVAEREAKKSCRKLTEKARELEGRVLRAREALESEPCEESTQTLRRCGFAGEQELDAAEQELLNLKTQAQEAEAQIAFLDRAQEAEKAVFLDAMKEVAGAGEDVEAALYGADELREELAKEHGEAYSQVNLEGFEQELWEDMEATAVLGDAVREETRRQMYQQGQRRR